MINAKKLSAALLVAVMLVSVLAGCGTGKTEKSRITFGNVGEFASFNPILSTDVSSGNVNELVYNGLVKLNEKLVLVGDLAETWDVSGDGLVWTFHLRKGIKWHDGQPFTAADVKFTFDAIKDPDYTGVRATDFEPVDKIEAPDDNTVVLHLSEPSAPLLSHLTIGIIAKHVFESTPIKSMKENPASMNPIGTGPYKFNAYVKGQYVLLDANANYFLGEPKIKETVFKVYQDTQVQLAGLEKGDIDYLATIPPDEVDRIKKDYAAKFDFKQYPENRLTYIGLKQTNPVFKDVRVRQALMYGLNRDQIVADVLKGYGTVLNAILPPFSTYYAGDALNPYKFDQEKAKQLLEEAGWKVGPDGIRVKDGKRLSFEALTASGNKQYESVMNIAQQQWKEIGAEAKPEYLEFSVLCAQYLDVAKFESYLLGFSLGIDPDFYLYLHSASAVDANGKLLGFNDVEFKNAQLDQLLEAGRRETDPAKRQQIYIEAQKIINDQLPWIFLYARDIVSAMNKRVQNVVWSPLGPINQEQWTIGK